MATRKGKPAEPEAVEWPPHHIARIVPFAELEGFLNAAAEAGFAMDWDFLEAPDEGDDWKGGGACKVWGVRE